MGVAVGAEVAGTNSTEVTLTYDWSKATDKVAAREGALPARAALQARGLPGQPGLRRRRLTAGPARPARWVGRPWAPYAGRCHDRASNRTVYLDHAATTPMLPAARRGDDPHLARRRQPELAARPRPPAPGGSSRSRARRSRRRSDCRPGEVVFTSGGTEADNLALKGIFWARRDADPRRTRILSTAVEHHAVLDPLHWLARGRAAPRSSCCPVDRRGRLDVDGAARRRSSATPASVALVSVMWANNEVGTLQPIDEVVALAAEHGIPVHTDAVQAVGAVPVDFAASGVDALTLTGHKLGGPYGVGALVVRRELAVTALLHGGGQERDIRSGTLDMPAIAGFATAVEPRSRHQPEHAERVAALRDDLVRRVVEVVPDAHLHGDAADATGCPATPTSASPTARATRC